MRFYKNEESHIPVEEFLDALPPSDAQKILWTLRLISKSEWTPIQYVFEHKEDEETWEFRIGAEAKNYWFLAFKHKKEWVLVNADFSTNSQKAPETETEKIPAIKEKYTSSFRLLPGDDLQKYITLRKKKEEVFAEGFEEGYLHFKIGSLLRQLREEAGLTQKELAKILNTNSSSISQMENHAEEIDLELLQERFRTLKDKLTSDLID